jgi:hypothetical protein
MLFGASRPPKPALAMLGSNPEFKDLAQSWGWKTITAHEKMK